MNNKVKLFLHLLAQILAQTAVIEIVPVQYKPVFAAIVAIVGVVSAFYTDSTTQ